MLKRSILPKVDELQANVLLQKPDIICIVETWLSEDVMDNEVLLPVRYIGWNVIGMVVALLFIHMTLCHVGYCCKVAHTI